MIITMTFPQGTPLHPREIGRPHSAGCRRVHICGLVAERSRGNRYSHFGLRLLIGLYVAGAISLVLLLSSKFDVDRLISLELLDQRNKFVQPEDTVYNIHNATVTFKLPAILAYLVGLPIPPKPTGNITAVLPYFDQNSTQPESVATQWVRTNLYSQGQSLFLYQPLWIVLKSIFCGCPMVARMRTIIITILPFLSFG